MNRNLFILFTVIALIIGCGKAKPKAEPTADAPAPVLPTAKPTPSVPANAAQLVRQIRQSRGETQLKLIESCEGKAASDPELVPALIEALSDTFTRGENYASSPGPGSTREAIILALLASGPSGEQAAVEKGLPILRAALSNPLVPIRGHAAVTLGMLGTRAKPALAELWKLAEDPNEFVRTSAIVAAREIDAPTPNPAPLIALLNHADADVRRTAAQNLIDFKPIPDSAVAALAGALNTKEVSTRMMLLEILTELGPKAEPAVPNLIQLLGTIAKEYEPAKREPIDPEPVFTLVAIGAPSVAPLKNMLNDKNPVARYLAVYALAELGPIAKTTAGDVEKLLTDQSGEVALEAARALATITGDAKKSSELMKLALGHNDAGTRAYGLETLTRMGKPGEELAADALPLIDDPDSQVRELAVEYVATLSSKAVAKAVPRLMKRLADENEGPQVRLKTMQVLAGLGTVAAPAATAMANALDSDDAELRDAATASLMALGSQGKAGLPKLLIVVQDVNANDDPRIRAMRASMAIAPEDAAVKSAVSKAIQDKSETVRIAAFQLIPQFAEPSADTIATLGTIAATDRSFVVRIRALQALAELGTRAKAVQAKVAPIQNDGIVEYAYWAKIAVARFENNEAAYTQLVRDGLNGKKLIQRNAAMQAIGRFVPATEADVRALETISHDRTATTREAALAALARSGAVAQVARPRMIELLKDRVEDVRIVAASALGQLGPDDATIAALREMARSKERLQVRAARAALRKLNAWE